MKIKSAVLGFAVGDALGVPAEFHTRSELDINPITDMKGFGTHPVPPGTWSDDTSMTLACLDSLSNGCNTDDMMEKFCNWLENAEYTATGIIFDVGTATRKSLLLHLLHGIPASECGNRTEYDNGNGSLMRILPVILYNEIFDSNLSLSEKISRIESVSSLTHAHSRSLAACGIYSFIVSELLKNPQKTAVYDGLKKADKFYRNHTEHSTYSRLFNNDISTLERSEIKSSGYVVHTLEAAIWCLLTTSSYSGCVLTAVNLGDDTDTTAAVAGGLAGLLYGYDNIPPQWLSTLLKREYIESLCDKASSNWKNKK